MKTFEMRFKSWNGEQWRKLDFKTANLSANDVIDRVDQHVIHAHSHIRVFVLWSKDYATCYTVMKGMEPNPRRAA